MKNYIVFTRTWWKTNPNYPNGLEPNLGRKKVLRRGLTRDEARQMCTEWNSNNNPGKLSRRAEFESN